MINDKRPLGGGRSSSRSLRSYTGSDGREHYRQCGYVIPPCFMCGKQVERGLLQFRAGGTLMLHFECARYLIGRLEVDLERPKRLPEMLVALADPIVKLPREKGVA